MTVSADPGDTGTAGSGDERGAALRVVGGSIRGGHTCNAFHTKKAHTVPPAKAEKPKRVA